MDRLHAIRAAKLRRWKALVKKMKAAKKARIMWLRKKTGVNCKNWAIKFDHAVAKARAEDERKHHEFMVKLNREINTHHGKWTIKAHKIHMCILKHDAISRAKAQKFRDELTAKVNHFNATMDKKWSDPVLRAHMERDIAKSKMMRRKWEMETRRDFLRWRKTATKIQLKKLKNLKRLIRSCPKFKAFVRKNKLQKASFHKQMVAWDHRYDKQFYGGWRHQFNKNTNNRIKLRGMIHHWVAEWNKCMSRAR